VTTINLRQLEVFHAVIEAGSVTGAADALNVTQPAVSAVLKHFEQRLQFKLFERVGGRLRPTPEAQALLPEVAEIFGRVRALGRVAEGMRDGLAGRVVIASSPTLADSLLPRAVARFRERNPGVTLALRSLPTPLVVERVSRREVDIGIAYGSVDDPGVEVEELMRSEIACVLPAAHPLAAKRIISASDLIDQPVITLERSSKLGKVGREIANQCESAGVPAPEPIVEPSSSLTACLLVREGAGIGLVDRTAALSGAFPDLAFRDFHPKIELLVQLVFPRPRPRSCATSELAAAVREVVAGGVLGAGKPKPRLAVNLADGTTVLRGETVVDIR
jgi:DNA-binding transcriptional LysR family regulator